MHAGSKALFHCALPTYQGVHCSTGTSDVTTSGIPPVVDVVYADVVYACFANVPARQVFGWHSAVRMPFWAESGASVFHPTNACVELQTSPAPDRLTMSWQWHNIVEAHERIQPSHQTV